MIGRLEKTVFDCPNPRALAAFYSEILGMRINEDDGDGVWVVIGRDTGWRELAFQRATPYLPPVWPDPGHLQRLHVDIRVDDVDAAERAVVALGATRLHDACDKGFQVFADPAGHPFCLVFWRPAAAVRPDRPDQGHVSGRTQVATEGHPRRQHRRSAAGASSAVGPSLSG